MLTLKYLRFICNHAGGVFLATGNSDSVIRVYAFGAATFEKICELEAHNVSTHVVCIKRLQISLLFNTLQ